jgi:hypothetical protein
VPAATMPGALPAPVAPGAGFPAAGGVGLPGALPAVPAGAGLALPGVGAAPLTTDGAPAGDHGDTCIYA